MGKEHRLGDIGSETEEIEGGGLSMQSNVGILW